MKYIIALAASLATATTGASVFPNTTVRQAVVTTPAQREMAQGPNRSYQTTTQRDKNSPSGGKTFG